MHTDADLRGSDSDAIAEDLSDAYLTRPLRLVFEPGHPESEHRPGGHHAPHANLDPAVARRIARERRLFLENLEPFPKRLLTDRAPQRAGKTPRLNARNPQRLEVGLGTPPRLVGRNGQVELAVPDVIGRRRLRARTPVRQLIGEPDLSIECVLPEPLIQRDTAARETMVGRNEHSWLKRYRADQAVGLGVGVWSRSIPT